ncbi:hypothetical protein FQN52_008825 [Onygenales sp. PD_12]|nr:hypothetical protein FQN52_008825 [Onygenales sp. PD_12]
MSLEGKEVSPHLDTEVESTNLTIEQARYSDPRPNRWSVRFLLRRGPELSMIAYKSRFAGQVVLMYRDRFPEEHPLQLVHLPHQSGLTFKLRDAIKMVEDLERLYYPDPDGSNSQWWIYNFIMDLARWGYLERPAVTRILEKHWDKKYTKVAIDSPVRSDPVKYGKGDFRAFRGRNLLWNPVTKTFEVTVNGRTRTCPAEPRSNAQPGPQIEVQCEDLNLHIDVRHIEDSPGNPDCYRPKGQGQ